MVTQQHNGEETVAPRVDLFGHLQLAEVPGAHSLAVQNFGEHLVEAFHIRARLELVGRYVDARNLIDTLTTSLELHGGENETA
jgi:hypothetical protein